MKTILEFRWLPANGLFIQRWSFQKLANTVKGACKCDVVRGGEIGRQCALIIFDITLYFWTFLLPALSPRVLRTHKGKVSPVWT